MVTLHEISAAIKNWSYKNFGNNSSKAKGFEGVELKSLPSLLGIGEEYGELLHVTLKHHQGIRGYDNYEQYKADRDDAIGDLVIYLMDYCNREDVDLFDVIQKVSGHVLKRDWTEDPTNGKIESV